MSAAPLFGPSCIGNRAFIFTAKLRQNLLRSRAFVFQEYFILFSFIRMKHGYQYNYEPDAVLRAGLAVCEGMCGHAECVNVPAIHAGSTHNSRATQPMTSSAVTSTSSSSRCTCSIQQPSCQRSTASLQVWHWHNVGSLRPDKWQCDASCS